MLRWMNERTKFEMVIGHWTVEYTHTAHTAQKIYIFEASNCLRYIETATAVGQNGNEDLILRYHYPRLDCISNIRCVAVSIAQTFYTHSLFIHYDYGELHCTSTIPHTRPCTMHICTYNKSVIIGEFEVVACKSRNSKRCQINQSPLAHCCGCSHVPLSRSATHTHTIESISKNLFPRIHSTGRHYRNGIDVRQRNWI